MAKTLIAILVIVAIIVIAAVIIDSLTTPPSPPIKKEKPTKVHKPSQTSPQAPMRDPVQQRWSDTPQRQSAARNAASEMSSHRVSKVDSDAVQIRRVICEKKLNINTQVLNTAVETSARLINHAEQIRREIETHRTESAYLIQLYRTGVGVSDSNHALRTQLKPIQDTLYTLSRSNPSLKPLFEQVRRLENTIYKNEIELNSRNRILRTYIRDNFGPRERRWAEAIEKRKNAKRTA